MADEFSATVTGRPDMLASAIKKTKTALDIDDDHTEHEETLEEVAIGDSPLEPEKEGIDPGGLKMDDYDE